VNAEARPDRREAAEGLVTPEAVATIDPFRLRRGEEEWKIVPGFPVTRREDFARPRFAQQPVQGMVASLP
jgi:hypothetical protein